MSEAKEATGDGASAAGAGDERVGGLPSVLTADEVAELLRADRKTIYAMIARGELPGVRRLGRAVRIHRDTVLGWLAQGQGRVSRSRGNR